jgi:hypothetical protein
VEIAVLDDATGKPVPCRVHLKDAAGKPRRPAKVPFWHDHFVCPGTAELDLPTGKYAIEVERGPEYELYSDSFTLTDAGRNSPFDSSGSPTCRPGVGGRPTCTSTEPRAPSSC